jgi:hypothetical protein
MKLGILCSKAMEAWWREVATQADSSVKLRVHHTDRGGISAGAQAIAEAVGDCKLLWVPTPAFDAAVLPRKPVLYTATATTYPAAAGSTPSLPLRQKSEIRHLREVAAAGKLGQTGMIRLSLCRSPHTPGQLAYNELSAVPSAFADLGPHAFDALRWCFGDIDRVHALQSAGEATYALCVARMASGAIAHIECSLAEPAGTDYLTYEIAGANGILEYDSRKEPLLQLNPHNTIPQPSFAPPELVTELRHFLESTTQQLATTAELQAAAVTLMEATQTATAMA